TSGGLHGGARGKRVHHAPAVVSDLHVADLGAADGRDAAADPVLAVERSAFSTCPEEAMMSLVDLDAKPRIARRRQRAVQRAVTDGELQDHRIGPRVLEAQ